jgi:hypothetical protein
MKKRVCLILILCLFIFCGPEQERVEKIVENGAEVIVNHLEPYRIKDQSSSLYLEEEISIDPEDDSIAALGLTDILALTADSGRSNRGI